MYDDEDFEDAYLDDEEFERTLRELEDYYGSGCVGVARVWKAMQNNEFPFIKEAIQKKAERCKTLTQDESRPEEETPLYPLLSRLLG